MSRWLAATLMLPVASLTPCTSGGVRAPCENTHSSFDPTSELCSYMDLGDCGPRGNDTNADLTSCTNGYIETICAFTAQTHTPHPNCHPTPPRSAYWDNYNHDTVVTVDGCSYIRYTCYDCDEDGAADEPLPSTVMVPPPSDLVVTVYADPECAGAQRALGASDFAGGRHELGWDACDGEWDDGTPMEYQSERATWWGAFRVAAGRTVSTGASCHDDFDYGEVGLMQVDVGAAAGCVSPSYDFNYLSLRGGGALPPSPPSAPPRASCTTAAQCNWPEEYCHCDAPYSEPVSACAAGECRPTDPSGELALVVAQRGGGCDAQGKIWWRHSYVSNVDVAADETLDADFDTSVPQLCARAAAMEPRCGDAVQWSPAYSWEWGCFCCAPGAATTADNENWNVLAFAASVRAGCVQVTLSTSYGEFSTEANWLLDGVMKSVAECGDGGSCEQVVCLQPGAHTLELFDSYGDGWNGAVVQVAAEGALLLEASLDGGSYAAHDFSVGGNSPSPPPEPFPFPPPPAPPPSPSPPPPPPSDLVVTVYADPECAGAQRALGASDFAGGRHELGWDACDGEWDDGTPMEYQSERATWWGAFRVAAGRTVSTGASCHDDFDYGEVGLMQVDVGAAAGCVSPSYDFNYLSLRGGGALPPSPPSAPPRASCTTAAQCNWPEEYCHCDAPYSEPVSACAAGECRPTDPSGELALVVAQRGGGCDAQGKIWWRHSYVSNVDVAADETLDADFDTSVPQLCARAAAMEPRCGDAVQWSPAYSWEWGCFCCAPGAATTADNENWNVLAFAASVRAGCVQVTLSTSYGEFSTEANWLLDGVMKSVAECGDGGSCEQVVCLQPGAHTLELFDSYGDGWNGAVVQVAAEGALLLEASLDGGSYAAHDFSVGGNSPSPPPERFPFPPPPAPPPSPSPPPPTSSDLVVTVYADPECAGAQRALGASDFAGGRHELGWDACDGEWDDGTPMEYQSERATWWGAFRVAAGRTVSTGASCHDDFDYGEVGLMQVDVGAAAGCVSPSYDFNYLSLRGGGALPPSPSVESAGLDVRTDATTSGGTSSAPIVVWIVAAFLVAFLSIGAVCVVRKRADARPITNTITATLELPALQLPSLIAPPGGVQSEMGLGQGLTPYAQLESMRADDGAAASAAAGNAERLPPYCTHSHMMRTRVEDSVSGMS